MAAYTFILLCLISYCQAQLLIVYVDGVKGNDSHQCLDPSSTMKPPPCKTLSFVSKNLTQTDFVTIKIVSDTLILTKAVNFTGYTNLTISGFGGNTTLCCSESDAGLAFKKVKNLSIISLTIKNCGALRPSTSVDQNQMTIDLPVAVYILNSTNVYILSVNIVSSIGTGLSLYDTNGQVDIVNCDFTGNSVGKNESGGGGVHIEFTICSPGLDMQYCGSHNGQNSNSRYTIQNCNFTENAAYFPPHQSQGFIPPSRMLWSVPRLGKGGGLYLSTASNAANNSFIVADSTFKNNRASYNAGGMFVEFLNFVNDISVSLRQTHFEGNNSTQTKYSGGGGLVIAIMFYSHYTHTQASHNVNFTCHSCSFRENRSNMGGGTVVYATRQSDWKKMSNITLTKCNWTLNEAFMGAAVFITPAIWDYTEKGYFPNLMFTDCMFDSNSAVQPLKPPMAEGYGVKVESVGYAAVFISELRVVFEGSVNFYDNIGTAVHLSNSVIEFRAGSNVIFFNNTSHIGGAIAMFGSSAIQIDNSSQFLFKKNHAYSRGGAIYFSFNAATHPSYHNCFIIPQNFFKVNSTLIFTENSAEANGSSIFTTTFQSCALLCSSPDTFNSPKEIMECIAHFIFNDSTNSSLLTHPDKFYLKGKSPIKFIPGIEYSLNLSVCDEANSSLNNVVYEASVASQNITVDPAFMQVSRNKIKMLGMNGARGRLELITSNIKVSFETELTECQPGYNNSFGKKCECIASDYLGVQGCYPNVYIKQGYWMGYCSEETHELCTGFCPHGFCSYFSMKHDKNLHELPNTSELLDSHICTHGRTNRLCGKCTSGYSVYHNSFKRTCGKEKLCHLGWLFYILSDIVPITLLFLVVLVMNISFTTGNANAFVLYCQILGSLAYSENDTIELSETIKTIQKIVAFPYEIFNLNFFFLEGLSYCPWKGASFLGTMILNYLTVGFALTLVLLTIVLNKCPYTRLLFIKCNSRNSVLIHGFSAFFILCYSQAAQTTFHIINRASVYKANFASTIHVVQNAGYIEYLSREHIPYAIPAFLVLIFMIVIPPLLLLVYPLVFKLLGLCKLSETRLAHVLWRVMPIQFLDAFQSSFKDKYRFFAGLYFLYRAAILALYMTTQTWLDFYSSVQLLLISSLIFNSLLQPHKQMKHNIIDSLLFANLCIINAITLYNYSGSFDDGEFNTRLIVTNTLAVVQAVLVILPLVIYIKLHVCQLKKYIVKQKEDEYLPSLRIDERDPLIQD